MGNDGNALIVISACLPAMVPAVRVMVSPSKTLRTSIKIYEVMGASLNQTITVVWCGEHMRVCVCRKNFIMYVNKS